MLSYRNSGQGMPVVLIHAFPFDSGMWREQIKFMQQKSRVIALDLPGFGRSACDGRQTIAAMAGEVAGQLEALEVKAPVMICGLSMGGYVALEFFRQFPERVRALGLFSTRAGADTPEGREKRLKTAEEIRSKGLTAFFQELLPNLAGKTTRETRPSLLRVIEAMMASGSPEGVAQALVAMAHRSDLTGLLETLRCPVLVLAGEEDTLIPCTESEAMHRQIPGSRFQRIEKAGHLVNLEQPEAFQKAFEDFWTVDVQGLPNP